MIAQVLMELHPAASTAQSMTAARTGATRLILFTA